jgi:hypothetical protein
MGDPKMDGVFSRKKLGPIKKLNRRGRRERREKEWKIGMMERWNIGKRIVFPIIPVFQYSSIPVSFLCG